jgi:hypothetical protein
MRRAEIATSLALVISLEALSAGSGLRTGAKDRGHCQAALQGVDSETLLLCRPPVPRDVMPAQACEWGCNTRVSIDKAAVVVAQ